VPGAYEISEDIRMLSKCASSNEGAQLCHRFEAIGEYGLSPDDVHDSLNFWMNTGWDDSGTFIPNIKRNKGRKGDTITLIATNDVLAVPNVCGSGDVSNTSNYFFRPIRIQIIERSPDTDGLTHLLRKRYMGFKNQRTVADFRIPEIKTERALKRDPDYQPRFVNYPLQIEELDIDLDDEDMRQVKRLVARGLADDTEDAVRSGSDDLVHQKSHAAEPAGSAGFRYR
jgi:hypothetical protein